MPFDATAHPAAADTVAAGKQALVGRAAVAARVAPIGGIAAASMRQATRWAGQHAALLLARVRRSSRTGAGRYVIAAEGLAAAGEMIARYRGGGRFTSDDEIARVTAVLRDLRVRDNAWPGWTRRTRTRTGGCGSTRPATQPGHVAAPAALLALASSCQHQVMARAMIRPA